MSLERKDRGLSPRNHVFGFKSKPRLAQYKSSVLSYAEHFVDDRWGFRATSLSPRGNFPHEGGGLLSA